MKSRGKKLATLLFVGLLTSVVLIFHLFLFLSRQYQHSNAYSSASNLIEINQQGAINIGNLLSKDQQDAREIKEEIDRQSFADESALLGYLSTAKQNWNVDAIYVYTSTGRCYDTSGTQNGSIAAQRAADIVSQGESFNIIKTQTEYSISVNTSLTLHGSQVVAVSILHDLDRLFKTINLNPYSGKGAIYLTQQNGIKVCSDGDEAQDVYNILTVLESLKLEELTGSGTDIESVMANSIDGAYLATDSNTTKYVVLSPIAFMGQTYYLFEIIPQSIVNTTMNSFTKNLTSISVAMMLLLLLVFMAFFTIYQRRTQRYTADIQAREHMFDLLVSHTQNAFMLLEEGSAKPVYVTSNTEAILGDNKVSIQKVGSGYRLIGSGTGLESQSISGGLAVYIMILKV